MKLERSEVRSRPQAYMLAVWTSLLAAASVQSDAALSIEEANAALRSVKERVAPAAAQPRVQHLDLDERVLQQRAPNAEETEMLRRTGYPTIPLTLSLLGLCGGKFAPILPSQYPTCGTDDTCVACRGGHFKAGTELLALMDASVASRTHWIASRFNASSIGERAVIVVALSIDMLDFFDNWICSTRSIGLNVKRDLIVVASDVQAEEKLRAAGFHVLGPSLTGFERKPTYDPHSANTGSHGDINTAAYTVFEELITLHRLPVIYQDVDLVWLKNPLPFLRRYSQNLDFVGMLAPRLDAIGIINTGFMYFKPTPRSAIFVRTLRNAIPVKDRRDQVLLNMVVRHHRFGSLRWSPLPSVEFALLTGMEAHPEAIVLHCVGTEKRERMMRGVTKAWHLDAAGQCFPTKEWVLPDVPRADAGGARVSKTQQLPTLLATDWRTAAEGVLKWLIGGVG